MPLSRRKKLIFSLIPALTLVALALLAEVGLRLFGGRFADDPYLNLAMSISIFKEEDHDGERFYRVWHPQAYGFRGMSFPIEKKPETFRVFCLGGSACAGYPHPPEEDFGDYLEHALRAAFPDRKFEVLNVAAQGFASYRVRDVFDDVIEFDPDLIVLYSGNNEFLEKRTYLGTTRTLVQSSYLIRFANIVLGKWFTPENSLSAWGFSRDVELSMIFAKLEQVSLELRTDPAQFRQVQEHYAYSIGHMLSTAAARGVPAVAVTVPANLREWYPNVSHHELQPPEAAKWQRAFDEGCKQALLGRHEAALKALLDATMTSPEHAETKFRIAKQLDALDQVEDAAAMYDKAKELDGNPFRALHALNDTVRRLAAEHDAILIDAEAAFRAAAQRIVPGWDLFLDYVHPNRRGNELLARLIFEAIVARKLVGTEPASTTFVPPRSEYDETRDVDMNRELVTLYITMHQYESIVNRAAATLEMIERGEGVFPADGNRTRADYVEFFERARDVHLRYLEADNARLLGEPFDPEFRSKLTESYRAFFFSHLFQEADQNKKSE